MNIFFEILFYIVSFGAVAVLIGLICSLAEDLHLIAMILGEIKKEISNKKRMSL